jgi:hypothetical protein
LWFDRVGFGSGKIIKNKRTKFWKDDEMSQQKRKKLKKSGTPRNVWNQNFCGTERFCLCP